MNFINRFYLNYTYQLLIQSMRNIFFVNLKKKMDQFTFSWTYLRIKRDVKYSP